MQSVTKRIESAAIASYVALVGVGYQAHLAASYTALPLSSTAKRMLLRYRARTNAGLAELAAVQAHRLPAFVSPECNNTALCICVMCTRRAAHNYQLAVEVQNANVVF